MPDTPFKFLDAYDKEDKDRFFGRNRETAQLYNAVQASNLVLLYGASGTGKTSLVNCGLANTFYDTDWLPVFIRRGQHLSQSLNRELRRAYDGSEAWNASASLPDQVQQLYRQHYLTIYLIFDQFEELYVLGSREEQETFYTAIADLLKADLPCKVLFIIREEYIAYLSDFEKRVPSLFDNRLRIEKMNERNLYRVITGTAKQVEIQIEEPAKTIPAIVENIRDPREGVELAHVQIYLDKLYRNDQKRIVQSSTSRPVRFDPALVGATKQLEGVISDFVDEQLRVLEGELKLKSITQPNVALEILFSLVTDDGTKRMQSDAAIAERLSQRLGIDADTVAYCIQRFHELKLVRILPEE